MAKLNILGINKGITKKKIMKLMPAVLEKMSAEELLPIATAVSAMANKRLGNLSKVSYATSSPAYVRLLKHAPDEGLRKEKYGRKSIMKLSVKNLTSQQSFIDLIISGRNFIASKTSTAQGFEQYTTELQEALHVKLGKNRLPRFYRMYRQLRDMIPVLKDKGGTNPVKDTLMEWYRINSSKYRNDEKLLEVMREKADELYRGKQEVNSPTGLTKKMFDDSGNE